MTLTLTEHFSDAFLAQDFLSASLTTSHYHQVAPGAHSYPPALAAPPPPATTLLLVLLVATSSGYHTRHCCQSEEGGALLLKAQRTGGWL